EVGLAFKLGGWAILRARRERRITRRIERRKAGISFRGCLNERPVGLPRLGVAVAHDGAAKVVAHPVNDAHGGSRGVAAQIRIDPFFVEDYAVFLALARIIEAAHGPVGRAEDRDDRVASRMRVHTSKLSGK